MVFFLKRWQKPVPFSKTPSRAQHKSRPARLVFEELETRLAPAVITTIAGNGSYGYAGDGGPGPSGSLYLPFGAAVDSSGNVYVADTYNSRIREIEYATGNIITVAGSGSTSFYGDGGPAIYAGVARPNGVAVDSSGNIYFTDTYNSRIREVVKATGNIITIAGNGLTGFGGDGGPATSARINYAFGIAVDSSGNVFFADQGNNRVREIVKATGQIITIAGTGTASYNGDNIPATSAMLNQPNGVAVDADGNVYISDWHNSRIRQVVKATGQIITIAGNGTAGFSGDGGMATSARVNNPGGVAVDGSGNIFIADASNQRIRKIDKATGFISTIAGNGVAGFSGDGGSPTSAAINLPYGIAADNSGNVYFTDSNNHRVRQILNPMGLGGLSTSAWTVNQPGYSCSIAIIGGAAPFSNLSATGLPSGLTAALSNSTIVVSGTPTSAGTFSNVALSVQDAAGNIASRTFTITINAPLTLGALSPNTWTAQVQGFYGSLPISGGTGALTLISQANVPPGMNPVLSGTNIYLQGIPSTPGNYNNIQLTIRDATGATGTGTVTLTVNAPSTGSILTVAGNYYAGYSGDGGPANRAQMNSPYSVAVDGSGDIYIADYQNSRIRKVVKATGAIITVAGTGQNGFSGDGGPASSAQVYFPTGVAVDADGNVYIADSYNRRIRKIVKATGIIITVAGNGASTDSGDGGPATAAGIATPQTVAVDASGNLYIADTSTNRIRKVVKDTGTIITIAGTGTAGFSGDNGPATTAMLNNPYGVAVDSSGNVYIADSNNNRVRQIEQATGNIITIAGNGTFGYSGNNGPATSAKLYSPKGVAVDSFGNVFIADTFNSTVRMVQRYNGDNIVAVAGVGTSGYSGDGGPATSGKLYWPYSVSLDGNGNLFIADMLNNVVRQVLLYPFTSLGALAPIQWTANQSGYAGSIAVTNAPPPSSCFLSTSGMPPGLTATLNANNDSITISGTPTSAGTYYATLTLRGISGAPFSSRAYSFTINAAPTLGALSSSQWTVGQAGYSGNVAASGGTGALTLSAPSNLPTGLSATMAGSLITISGMPTTVGTFNNIQLTVLDAIGAMYTGTYSITINPTPTLGTLSTNTWMANQAGFSGTVPILGGTIPNGNLTAAGLPPGLSAALSGNVITISGTPTTIGAYNNIQLSVQDSTLATASAAFAMTVSGPAVSLSLANYLTIVTAGASNSFTIAALDALGSVVTGYRGTVSLSSSDPITGSPTTYTFTAADNGVHTFTFNLETVGSQQLYASDATAGISGFSAPITVSPAALDHFVLTGPASSASYYSFNITATAKDAFNNTIPNYNGTVHFTSSDSAATLPADYTFTPGDQGTHAFSATLQTTGTQTIVINDSNNVAAIGTVSVPNVDYVPGLHFVITRSVATATAGAAFDIALTALDQNDNVAIHYEGTVSFSSTDLGSGVVLPANYTFTAADNGVHTFAGGVTLVTAGNQSLSVVDISTLPSGGYGLSSSGIAVTPAPASAFTITGLPLSMTRGVAQAFSVTAKDAYDNIATGYNGAVHFTSGDPQAVLPPDTTLNAGAGSFQVTFASLGAQSLAVADASNGALTATQGGITVNPAPAVSLAVDGFPTSTTAGASGTFTVTATDAYGYVASGYSGTIHFASSDPLGLLPADIALSNGAGSFTTTFKSAGIQSLTATDVGNASLSYTVSGIAVAPAAASNLLLTGLPATITAGANGTVTVTVLDAYGNLATNYSGTIRFTSSDAAALLPADYTFTTSDAGVHAFAIILKTAGAQSVTLQDATNSLTTAANTSVTAAAASRLMLAGIPATTTAGLVQSLSVTAMDSYGNVANGYTGTVHISSSDSQAVLPADYTFTPGDVGIHNFSVTLKTAGYQSLDVHDVPNNLTAAQAAITVTPATAVSLNATAYPAATTAGVTESITIVANDAYGNISMGYRGTVRFSSSDSQASLPADYIFTAADAGVHAFAVVLKTAAAQTITLQDATNGFSAAANIAVTGAAANRFELSGFPPSTTAGIAQGLTITARDTYGNFATGYTGTVHFSSSDSAAALPADFTFSNNDLGVHAFSASFRTAGTQSLTATDTAAPAIAASQTGISVVAGATSRFTVSGYPGTTAGVSNNFTVTATDAYGNRVSGYRGTVRFAASDGQAGLPGNYTFIANDNGAHTFAATLKTAGSQSLTATDTATSSITGAQSGIIVTAAAATRLAITAPANALVNVAVTITVTAFDAYGNIATGYLGAIRFTSNDNKAILPNNYTFVAADGGVHSFTVTFKSKGTKSLTATDMQIGTIKGIASVIVS